MTGQQLKNSILQMAVQGKLVPQDPNDEPASVLLERIRAEKEQLIKEGKIKKEKNPSVIFRGADNLPYEKVGKNEPVCIADEVPFDIPESWEWVRLKDIVVKEIKRGKSPTYADNSSVLVFAQKCNTKAGIIDLSLAKHLDFKSFAKYSDDEYMQDGDIVVNSTGNGTLGRVGVFHDSDRSNDCVIVPDSHVTTIRINKTLVLDYIYYALVYYQPYFEKSCSGSTNQTELKPLVIANLFIPVPPFKEQRRIIRKLSSVLPLVTKYDEKEVALEIYNTAFPAQLKKSILQDAVQGKLVPQNPADEPASVLLERIRTEKEQLVKVGKIKRDKHESVIFRRDNSYYEKVDGIERCIDDELPFEIPENWEWVRFFSIVEIATNLVSPERYFDYMHIAPDNIEKSTGTLLECRTVAQDKVSSPNHLFFMGQILYSKIRPLLRKAVIAPFDGLCSADMYPLKTPLNKEYLLRYILSDSFNAQVATAMSSRVKMPKINQAELSKVLIPVPPIQEQERIVNKIKELYMALV